MAAPGHKAEKVGAETATGAFEGEHRRAGEARHGPPVTKSSTLR